MKNVNQILFLLFISFCFLFPIELYAQWQEAFSFQKDWSNWSSGRGSISYYSDDSGLILKNEGGQVYFRFQITNYSSPSKKTIKQHYKSKQWYEYTGVVEYYVNDTYPTAEAIAKASQFVIPNMRQDVTPNVMRKTTCRVKIEPYKKQPATYNVFFDNIGVAISVKGESTKTHISGGRVAANIAQSILLFPIGVGSWWWNPVKIYDKRQ